MSDYSVSVNDDDAMKAIRKLTLFVSDLRPFWPLVRSQFVAWMRLQFDSEGAFWGQGLQWAPLSPAYADAKRELWGAKPIMQATGQARQAASRPLQEATPLSLTLWIDDSVGSGATDAKGNYHAAHGEILHFHQDPEPGAPYPRRQIIGDTLPPLATHELENLATTYIGDLIRRL